MQQKSLNSMYWIIITLAINNLQNCQNLQNEIQQMRMNKKKWDSFKITTSSLPHRSHFTIKNVLDSACFRRRRYEFEHSLLGSSAWNWWPGTKITSNNLMLANEYMNWISFITLLWRPIVFQFRIPGRVRFACSACTTLSLEFHSPQHIRNRNRIIITMFLHAFDYDEVRSQQQPKHNSDIP